MSVIINVKDVNDETPTFSDQSQTTFLIEEGNGNMFVGQVMVSLEILILEKLRLHIEAFILVHTGNS